MLNAAIDTRAPLADGSSYQILELESEIVTRMARYKRSPSKAQLFARLGNRFGQADIEHALIRLLGTGQIAVTGGLFWLRRKRVP